MSPNLPHSSKVTLAQILNNESKAPFTMDEFRRFLTKEHSEENIEFWEAVIRYRQHAATAFPGLAHACSNRLLTNIMAEHNGSITSIDALLTSHAASESASNLNASTAGDHSQSVTALPHSTTVSALGHSLEALSLGGGHGNAHGGASDHSLPTLSNDSAGVNPEQLAKLRDEVDVIMKRFLSEGSEKEVNLPAKIRRKVTTEVYDRRNYHPDVFRPALEHAYMMMKLSSFPNFIKAKV
ncbi:hypothetical protein HK101_010092 [Irineochytrium annulatum]|nr:hypothetical protein HK101_010092 [Irineochytrium annulatum]